VSTVAVVGLGAMGSRIARRLLETGHDVVVWNRTAAKAAPLVELGAAQASTPAEAAARAEAVVTMVSDERALQEVTDGADGVAAGALPTTIVQMSTVGPGPVARLAAGLPEGVELLDAPVLGSVAEVESGSLQLFVGGDAELLARWTPLLGALGRIVPVGPVGAGSAAKLVANASLFGAIVAVGEALALGISLGLPVEVAFDVLAATPLAAQAERRRPSIESGEYPTRFALDLARKDADMIAAAASAAGAELRIAEAVRSWFADAAEAGLAASDYSSVLAYVLERSAAAEMPIE
jgi:3-hydroxyisobutyrate dehydrogenase-like beta-hydroxyacid dehydrogenase